MQDKSDPLDTNNEGLPKVPTSQPRFLGSIANSEAHKQNKIEAPLEASRKGSVSDNLAPSTIKTKKELSKPINLIGDLGKSPQTPGGKNITVKSDPVKFHLNEKIMRFVQSTETSVSNVGQTPLSDLTSTGKITGLKKPESIQSCQIVPVDQHVFDFASNEQTLSVGKIVDKHFWKESANKIKPVENSKFTENQTLLKPALRVPSSGMLFQSSSDSQTKKVAFSSQRMIRIYDSEENEAEAPKESYNEVNKQYEELESGQDKKK